MNDDPPLPNPGPIEHYPLWELQQINSFDGLVDLFPETRLDVIKLSPEPVSGTKAISVYDGTTAIVCTVFGNVALRGTTPPTGVTIEVGLPGSNGSLHWLHPVGNGRLLQFPPGSEYDCIRNGPAEFICCTVAEDHLQAVAEQMGKKLPQNAVSEPHLYGQPLDGQTIQRLETMHKTLIGNHNGSVPSLIHLRQAMLELLVKHIGHDPEHLPGKPRSDRYSAIVRRARDWIEAHLDQRITVDMIAREAATSRRTLHRAFIHVIGESARAYVLRLRLHRIRRELKENTEAETTVAKVANHWEISELGRLSARYRALFGELPSQTLSG